jgi:hypothetical protein
VGHVVDAAISVDIIGTTRWDRDTCRCVYNLNLKTEGRLADVHDFIPDRSNNTSIDKAYNLTASLFSGVYYDAMGATKPKTRAEWTDDWHMDGWKEKKNRDTVVMSFEYERIQQ